VEAKLHAEEESWTKEVPVAGEQEAMSSMQQCSLDAWIERGLSKEVIAWREGKRREATTEHIEAAVFGVKSGRERPRRRHHRVWGGSRGKIMPTNRAKGKKYRNCNDASMVAGCSSIRQ
jgi:hypothetical protein